MPLIIQILQHVQFFQEKTMLLAHRRRRNKSNRHGLTIKVIELQLNFKEMWLCLNAWILIQIWSILILWRMRFRLSIFKNRWIWDLKKQLLLENRFINIKILMHLKKLLMLEWNKAKLYFIQILLIIHRMMRLFMRWLKSRSPW